MAKKNNEVNIEFKATTKEFESNIKSSNATLKTLRGELKLNATELKGDADNVDLLTKRQQLLVRESEASKSKIDSLNSELKEAQRLFGDNSKEVYDLNNKLVAAKTQYAGVQNELKATDSKINELNTDTKSLNNTVKDSSNHTAKSAKGFTVLKGVIANLTSFIIQKTISGFKNLFGTLEESAKMGDEIDKVSQKLGFSYKTYQEWDYVLSQAGVEITSMTTGLKTMTNKIDDAKNGNKAAVEMFNKLGISIKDLKEMSREDVFGAIITSMQGMKDSTERAALANDLFGKSGQNLTPLFNASVEATEQLKQKANELGMVMSDDAVKSSVDYVDALDTVDKTTSKLKGQLLSGLLPALTDVTTELTDNIDIDQVGEKIKGLGDKINALVGFTKQAVTWGQQHKGLLTGIAVVIGALTVAYGLYNAAKTLGNILNAAEVTTLGGLIAQKWAEVTANWALATSGMAALGPILLIVAAIAAVIAIGVLVVKNWDTIKAKGKELLDKGKAKIQGFVTKITGFFDKIKNFFKNNWKSLLLLIVNPFAGAFSLLYKHNAKFKASIDNLKTKVVNAFKAIPNAIKSIPSSISKIWDNLKSKLKVPKVSVSYDTSGTKAKIAQALGLEGFPKLSIKWNKNGAFFTRKTVVMNGYAEAGDKEYALPLNDRTLDPLAAGIDRHMNNSQGLSALADNVRQLWHEVKNGNSSIEGKIVNAVSRGVRFKINNREFGRAVRNV